MPVFVLLITIVALIGGFTLATVATWAGARRAERVAYYKSETLKKIAESQGAGAQAALDYVREKERIAERRFREGRRLGGLILIAVGLGLMILLAGVLDREDRGVIGVGAIPMLIGAALLVYSYRMEPKE